MPPTLPRPSQTPRNITWLLAAVAAAAAGCGGDKQSVATHPVSGQVLYKGKPAAGARVLFFYTSDELKGERVPTPQATVDEEGVFRVGCFGKKDGAPVGEYNLAVVWRAESHSGESRGDTRPPDRLKGRYARPGRSGLTATVVEGDNVIPTIQLK